jgi:hypothetical protein
MSRTPKIGCGQHNAPAAVTADIIAIFSGGEVSISPSIDI